ncbi:MAG TPA: hypothetical protein EYH05_18580, partial [Anaerolineae bacterium]|nr:hypothetical protein [Anaerolineae bacterium]
MTFPVVSATNSGVDGANTTLHTINLPANINSGDLLLAFFCVDGPRTTTWPSGWTKIVDDVAANTFSAVAVAYRVADGTEGSTISVTSSASEQSSHVTYRITNWHGASPPEAASAIANTQTPDPPSLTVSWGADDNLFVAGVGNNDGTSTPTSWPVGYTANQASGSGGAGGTNISVCT